MEWCVTKKKCAGPNKNFVCQLNIKSSQLIILLNLKGTKAIWVCIYNVFIILKRRHTVNDKTVWLNNKVFNFLELPLIAIQKFSTASVYRAVILFFHLTLHSLIDFLLEIHSFFFIWVWMPNKNSKYSQRDILTWFILL